MSQGLFDSGGTSERVEFIGYAARRAPGCRAVAIFVLLTIFTGPLMLLFFPFGGRRPRSVRLVIDPSGVSWGKADGSEALVSMTSAEVDHVEVRRRGTKPVGVVLVPKNGRPEPIPDDFNSYGLQGILAELHKWADVRELDLPEHAVTGQGEVDALVTSGRAEGERVELPDGVRWLAPPLRGPPLLVALLVVATCIVPLVAGIGRQHGISIAVAISGTYLFALLLFAGWACTPGREALELRVTKDGISCGRPSEPELWEHIRAEDLEAIHWSEVEGVETTEWQLAIKTVQSEYIEMWDRTLRDYGPDICHVAATLHPHVKLALANLPQGTRCRRWPRTY